MSDERCDRCKELGQDRRTLWMCCFYDMCEFDVPFEEKEVGERPFYTLRVCKGCRGDWIMAIQEWFHATPEHLKEIAPLADIPVRQEGRTVMMTADEYEEYQNEQTSSDS